MKRKLVAFLTVLLALSLLMLCAAAAEPTASGTLGENISWSITDGVLTLQGTGAVESKNGVPYFSGYEDVTAIVVEEGITAIGSGVFSQMRSVTQVSLPQSLRTIGNDAFFFCTSLEELELPSNLKTLGSSAFSHAGLVRICVPDSVTTFGTGVFGNCAALEEVTLPANMTILPDETFHNCTALKTVQLPQGLEKIYYAAFWGSGLTSIEIPSGVTMLASYTFADCYDLTEVLLPEGLKIIDGHCFENCISLTALELPAGMTSVGDGSTFAGSGLIELTIPSGPESIALWTFQNCYQLKKVTIESGVTQIGREVFAGCPELEEVVLPATLTKLGESVFADSGLIKTAIPNGVEELPKYAFARCTRLKQVTLPDTLEFILSYAFDGCESMTRILLPDRLKRIDEGAFHGTGLTMVQVPLNVHTVGASSFGNCPALETVLFAEAPMFIHGGAFLGSESVKIYCFENTDAHTFAESSGLPYQLLESGGSVFTDVTSDRYYYRSVLWAVGRGITTGTSKTRFSPDEACTRGQVVTFLWRAVGKPEPASTENPFEDVHSSDYYYKAVLWASEKGITTGTSKTRFSPDTPCNRAQVATFLWRAMGEPKSEYHSHSFRDMEYGSYYYEAAIWAYHANITTGTSNYNFSPDQPCTRAQVVTFLERAYG